MVAYRQEPQADSVIGMKRTLPWSRVEAPDSASTPPANSAVRRRTGPLRTLRPSQSAGAPPDPSTPPDGTPYAVRAGRRASALDDSFASSKAQPRPTSLGPCHEGQGRARAGRRDSYAQRGAGDLRQDPLRPRAQVCDPPPDRWCETDFGYRTQSHCGLAESSGSWRSDAQTPCRETMLVARGNDPVSERHLTRGESVTNR